MKLQLKKPKESEMLYIKKLVTYENVNKMMQKKYFDPLAAILDFCLFLAIIKNTNNINFTFFIKIVK